MGILSLTDAKLEIPPEVGMTKSKFITTALAKPGNRMLGEELDLRHIFRGFTRIRVQADTHHQSDWVSHEKVVSP